MNGFMILFSTASAGVNTFIAVLNGMGGADPIEVAASATAAVLCTISSFYFISIAIKAM